MQKEFELVMGRWRKRGNWLSACLALFLSHFPYYFLEERLAIIFIIGLVCLAVLIFIGVTIIPLVKEIPSREYCFKKALSIWGLWYTGRDIRKLGLLKKYPDKIKRILLLDPESVGFKENMKETGGYDLLGRGDIICLTRIAKGYGIPVRWYDTMQPRSLTFYDPEDMSLKKPWLVSRIAKRYASADYRPLEKHNKKDDLGEFSDNLALFKDIWENRSREPEPIEYEDITHKTA